MDKIGSGKWGAIVGLLFCFLAAIAAQPGHSTL